MARYASKIVKVSSLAKVMPYGFRHCFKDDHLKASIKRSGILMPIVVTNSPKPVVITGHRRLFAARTLKLDKVPVLVADRLNKENAFLLSLVSNWKQDFSDTDKATAIGKASLRFRMSEGDILSVVMPLLGLPEDKSLLGLYLKVDRFPRLVKDLIEGGYWPLRALTFFFKLSRSDQEFLAKKIGTKVRLTHSQLSQAGEWLVDIQKRTGKTLMRLFKEHKILEGWEPSSMDLRTQADRFFARVKQLRFPGYSQFLEEFEDRRAGILRDIQGLRLEPVQGFEEPGFELRGRVKNADDLERFLHKLSEYRPALNSLFEIVL